MMISIRTLVTAAGLFILSVSPALTQTRVSVEEKYGRPSSVEGDSIVFNVGSGLVLTAVFRGDGKLRSVTITPRQDGAVFTQETKDKILDRLTSRAQRKADPEGLMWSFGSGPCVGGFSTSNDTVVIETTMGCSPKPRKVGLKRITLRWDSPSIGKKRVRLSDIPRQ